MIVTFVSQCEKKALKKTRRVLDAFANRIGNRTWQTVISNEGLQAVKKLLRKTASKNTAVSCHWIRSRSRSEFIWVVGNRDKFNFDGYVPVNYTQKEGFFLGSESYWQNANVISLLASIAGLFHDFGKANRLFQNKLNPTRQGKISEPYRHEWVSLRLFQAFVTTYGDGDDKSWLQALAKVNNQYEKQILANLVKDDPSVSNKVFVDMSPVTKVIAWLIVSHHRLPEYPKNEDRQPQYKDIDHWLEKLDSLWNSPKSFSDDWSKKERADNWVFSKGTPFKSVTWQIKAKELAKKALLCRELTQRDWFEQRFTIHLSRLSLMLADHHYSSQGSTTKWQDPNYQCYANTDQYKKYKQHLDEHNIGVATSAYKFSKKLPKLKQDLPSIADNKYFIKNKYKNKEDKERFSWQDDSYKLSKSLQKTAKEHGFFGINMASTGFGKTLGNARIMYALADEKLGCRFNIALGLRTLTLQTGRALATILKLKKEDYAVLIGSKAVKMLDDLGSGKQELQTIEEQWGSESSQELFPEGQTINYGGVLNNEILSKWLTKGSERNPKLQQLIEAPLLISTIDHLVPATEGARGGKQIAPMLRLLTSDLVLDEPDDFGQKDLCALCRLVNWTAMLGGKVLLSTATMPPALSYALFEAYQAGWKDYTAVNGEKGATNKICCAWFDEFSQKSILADTTPMFISNHNKYTERRAKKLLQTNKPLCKARIEPIQRDEIGKIKQMAKTIRLALTSLHLDHYQSNAQGNKISIGLVRMANINPLVAIAKELIKIPTPAKTQIHYCIYHSKFPLLFRSLIETKLDALLQRHDPEAIWLEDDIKKTIEQDSDQQHIFVVLATSVAEVGRDHDYDWAVVEPSSMRSLIQIAGRIQRHRKQPPKTENMLILSHNYKALKGEKLAYLQPGFETKKLHLAKHDLAEILMPEQYQTINAVPRISFDNKQLKRDGERLMNLVDLEHIALFSCLMGALNEENNAKLWWQYQATWSSEIQKNQRFRDSNPESTFYLRLDHTDDDFIWMEKEDKVFPSSYVTTNRIKKIPKPMMAKGNSFWFNFNLKEQYEYLSSKFNLELKDVGKQLAEIHLDTNNEKENRWEYYPELGVYKPITDKE